MKAIELLSRISGYEVDELRNRETEPLIQPYDCLVLLKRKEVEITSLKEQLEKENKECRYCQYCGYKLGYTIDTDANTPKVCKYALCQKKKVFNPKPK